VNTTYTPSALGSSVANGKYKKCRLQDLAKTDADEVFLFRYPSPDLLNEFNGEGDFLEIWDVAVDLSSVTTARGDIKTTPDTTVYYTFEKETAR
jgi:hypothetical protein